MREGVAPVTGAGGVDVGVEGLVEMMPEGGSESSSGGKTETGMESGSGSGSVGEPAVESALGCLESDLGGSWVANEDLWEVDAVGSPSVRAMT